MKHRKLRKDIMLPVLLVGCLLLFLLAGGRYFTKYLRQQIFSERTMQLLEITSQVQTNLNGALDFNWTYLAAAVNALKAQEFDSAEEMPGKIGMIEHFLEMESNGCMLMALDDRGNCYDADGMQGVWPDIALIAGGEEQYTFITDSYIYPGGYWAFVQKLETPAETADQDAVFTHVVLLKSVQTMAEYYDSGAYGSRNETYILKSNGTRMHDNDMDAGNSIQAYNVLKVLEEMEGQRIPDLKAAVEEQGSISSNFMRDGLEYYFCIASLPEYDTLLLFLIPAEFVASDTVNMVGTVIRTLLLLAVILVSLLLLAVAAILRKQNGDRMFLKEQENLRRQEEMNGRLEESNAMLEKSKEAAEQAFRIAEEANRAKSSFLSNMSHDIRTPMNAIVGFATLLFRDAENPEKVREYTKKITASSQHLLGLINDILDISKIEAGKTVLSLSDENIVDLIENIDSIIRPQMKAKGHIFEVYSRDIVHEHVVMDKLRLNQILLNLLSNAVKYTPDGGHVTLTVQELPQHARKTAYYRFVVSDDGYGMSPEYVQKIFSAFTREEDSVTNKIQGTGLGMAITKNLVDLMGGSIQVKSEKGRGSVFTVDLTLHVGEQAVDHDFWQNHGITRVLAVDDEEVICKNIQMVMEKAGVQADLAADGKTAVQMVKQSGEEGRLYDVVLLDWKMPGIDGLETARRIRRETAGEERPILILLSSDWPEVDEEAMAAGIDTFMPKPFFLTSFRQKVEAVLDRETVPIPEEESKESILRGMHLLVAEDNEINSEILEEVLDMMGAACDICENGELVAEAFERSSPGQYQLILMDVQMPVMNGYEATRRIRASGHPLAKTIPIIAMTANAFAEDIQDAMDAGMNRHVAKPIDIGVLEQAVKEALFEKMK